MDNFKILTKTNRNNDILETLEALFIKELKPGLNTKEDFRNKELSLKFYVLPTQSWAGVPICSPQLRFEEWNFKNGIAKVKGRTLTTLAQISYRYYFL